MEVRADIFVNIPKFLEEMNGQVSSIQLQSPQPLQFSLATIQPSQDIPHNTRAQNQTLHQGAGPSNHHCVTHTASPLYHTSSANIFNQPPMEQQYPIQETNSTTLAAISRGRGGGFIQPCRPFCKTYYDADKGKSTYLSHNQSDARCPIRIQLHY